MWSPRDTKDFPLCVPRLLPEKPGSRHHHPRGYEYSLRVTRHSACHPCSSLYCCQLLLAVVTVSSTRVAGTLHKGGRKSNLCGEHRATKHTVRRTEPRGRRRLMGLTKFIQRLHKELFCGHVARGGEPRPSLKASGCGSKGFTYGPPPH